MDFPLSLSSLTVSSNFKAPAQVKAEYSPSESPSGFVPKAEFLSRNWCGRQGSTGVFWRGPARYLPTHRLQLRLGYAECSRRHPRSTHY